MPSGPLTKLGQADQVVGGQRQGEGSIDPGVSSQHDLGQAGGTLDPAEDLLDALATALADLVTGVTQVAELGRLTIAFLVQPCFGFGGAAVRFVGALFLLDAALRVRPGPSRSLSSPSLRRKLLIDAHASSSVPSPERWSLDSSPLTFGRATIAARTLAAISPSRSRPRFLEKLE